MNRLRILATVGAAGALIGATLMSSQAAHGAQAVTCAGHVATIVGTPGNDHIVGTDGPDVIAGLGGDDVILGLSGNDIICGGGGNDVINAMGGSGQQLFGDDGNDLCTAPARRTVASRLASPTRGCPTRPPAAARTRATSSAHSRLPFRWHAA